MLFGYTVDCTGGDVCCFHKVSERESTLKFNTWRQVEMSSDLLFRIGKVTNNAKFLCEAGIRY